MAIEKLKAYQIHFSEDSKSNCFPVTDWWRHYDNKGKLTPFFENSVISDLIENKYHTNSEYFAVFSHDAAIEISFKEGGLVFNPENLRKQLDSGFDVYSFQKKRRNTNMLVQANNYHPNFLAYTKRILDKLGLVMPTKLDKIVLFNHFVARSEIYQEYYEHMLKPAMEIMCEMDELNEDANYHKKHDSFTEQLGYDYYPYHPFICERLLSIWLGMRPDITFTHIF